jgi:hypothetical protein
MPQYVEHQILVLGKTYPSYSKQHGEVACTGGLLKDGLRMIRLHPLNFDELPDHQQFSAWQWITAQIAEDDRDARPGSYRIQASSIKPGERITESSTKAEFISSCANLFSSYEHLLEANKSKQVSLGIFQPSTCTGRVLDRSERERAEWEARQIEVVSQGRLFTATPRLIDFPEKDFMIGWRCFGGECFGHDQRYHDWGIHELSRKLRGDADRDRKLQQTLDKNLDANDKSIYFMMGNFHNHRTNFGLMGILSVPPSPRTLFNSR